MTERMRQFVRRRAGHRCEYCQLHHEDSPLAALRIEHVRPRKHGGTDDAENLVLACIDCNLRKGPTLTGIDPRTGAVTVLFHLRHDVWAVHFEWKGMYVSGLTSSGRTTVQVLELNSNDRLDLRLATGP